VVVNAEIVIFISKAGSDRSTCTLIRWNQHEKIIIKAAAVIAYYIASFNLRDRKLGHKLDTTRCESALEGSDWDSFNAGCRHCFRTYDR
jgi:hypothetical protein